MSGEVTVVEVMLLRSIAALIDGLYGTGFLPLSLCDTTETAFPGPSQPVFVRNRCFSAERSSLQAPKQLQPETS